MKKKINIATLILALILCCMKPDLLAQSAHKIVSFTTEDGAGIEGALFEARPAKVIIYAHGAVFNKESWYFLAEKFQTIGIASLCIDFRGYGKSTATNLNQKYYDVLGAIEYLTDLGYSELHIIGGSMGGAAVLEALNRTDNQTIATTVLLAPAGGPAIKSLSTKKLIVVARNEGSYDRVKTVYDESSEPKRLKEFGGTAHAQHMFKEDYAEELIQLIIDFIQEFSE